MTYSKDKVRAKLIQMCDNIRAGVDVPGWVHDDLDEALALLDAPEGEGREGPQWISVEERLPKHNRKKGSLGTEVLIWPRADNYSTAFYGRRLNDEASFYRHGAFVQGVTHWQELPDGPAPQASRSTDTKSHE